MNKKLDPGKYREAVCTEEKRDHIDEAIKTEIAKMPKDILIIYSND